MSKKATSKKVTKTKVAEKPAVKAVKKSDSLSSEKKKPEVKATETVGEIAETQAEADMTEKVIAKAGKRSAKAIAETEKKVAKEERKATPATTDNQEASKFKKKPTRSKLERSGKKFREASKLIDKSEVYSLTQALELATRTSPTKFDATVELHVNLNVDPKKADQNVRDTVVLPAGTGKSIRIAVLAEADDAAKALKAGAEIAGSDELFQELDKENINFDVLIATPVLMQRLSKYARLLGPRGLMPNPKSGTVATDIVKAVVEAKAGRVEYRVDSNGIIHLGIGKISFGTDKLVINAEAVMTSIRAAKPASQKSTYIKSLYVSSTMGPSINVQV